MDWYLEQAYKEEKMLYLEGIKNKVRFGEKVDMNEVLKKLMEITEDFKRQDREL